MELRSVREVANTSQAEGRLKLKVGLILDAMAGCIGKFEGMASGTVDRYCGFAKRGQVNPL